MERFCKNKKKRGIHYKKAQQNDGVMKWDVKNRH
jgi:hypothetical protein